MAGLIIIAWFAGIAIAISSGAWPVALILILIWLFTTR